MDNKRITSSDVNELFQQARACFEQDCPDRVEKIANVILAKCPDHIDAGYLLGIIAGKRGDYDLANLIRKDQIDILCGSCRAHEL